MSQPTEVQPVERMLAGVIHEQADGILGVNDGKIRRLFCFADGRLIHAASNLIEEQLEEYVVNEGLVPAAERDRAKEKAAESGMPAWKWMQENDVVTADQLAAATAAHAGALLVAALCSKNGEIAFQHGKPNLKDKPVTDIEAFQFLFEALKHHPKSGEAVRARLGNLAMHPVRVLEKEAQVRELAKAHPVLAEVWDRADGDLTVVQLSSAISTGKQAGWRALYGMQLLGAVEMISKKARKARRVEDVPVTRNEMMMRLEKAIDANHYGVLELTAQAADDEIRSSYYLLARRYHPDRFRAHELADLMPRIEAYFAQVTEAYNTLADPELRQKYDDDLTRDDRKVDEKQEADTSHLARQNYIAAKALIKKSQIRQAIKFLKNAIELEANVPQYHVEFGKAIGHNPVRREEAEEHLRRGLELDPTVMGAHTALADLLVKRKKKKNAILVLKEALKWFPDHPEIQQRLDDLGAGKKSRGLFGR